MNKTERLIVMLLFGALAFWMVVWMPKMSRDAKASTLGTNTVGTTTAPSAFDNTATTPFTTTTPANTQPSPLDAATNTAQTITVTEDLPDETIVTLANDVVRLNISSHGGSITEVELFEYPATQEADSPPVLLNFSDLNSLSLSGYPGFEKGTAFDISSSSSSSAIITRTAPDGLTLTRTLTLGTGYSIDVSDVFENHTQNDITLPRTTISLGQLPAVKSRSRAVGMSTIGVDTMAAAGGEDVEHWSKSNRIAEFFQSPANRKKGGILSCLSFGSRSRPPQPLPMTIRMTDFHDSDTGWIVAKNKFFAQILVPENPATGFVIDAAREPSETELSGSPGEWDSKAELASVGGGLIMSDRILTPGAAVTHGFHYFVGPKRYELMKPMGSHMADIMEWGWFSGICKVLLWGLQTFHSWGLGYGWAIVLLTVIIRGVFMPITRIGTENMKKMQEIQPQMKELQAKHKDDPMKFHKLQQALYKEHKVNPMLGCIPMLVQIPFFFALYRMLLSSVELRYSEWLWISDLSDIEGMLADVLPIPLNIMPLLMVITMIWQQKLTPQAGDPQMQKMMTFFLPIFMLFVCYNLPSGLMIYWTTSQLLMIATLSHKRKKDGPTESKTPAKA